MKYLRVPIVKAEHRTDLLCVVCGLFGSDWAIVPPAEPDEDASSAGVHKKCLGKLESKRGAA
jgi:hypothetical protein